MTKVLFGRRLTRMFKNGISSACSNSMVNLMLLYIVTAVEVPQKLVSGVPGPFPWLGGWERG